MRKDGPVFVDTNMTATSIDQIDVLPSAVWGASDHPSAVSFHGKVPCHADAARVTWFR